MSSNLRDVRGWGRRASPQNRVSVSQTTQPTDFNTPQGRRALRVGVAQELRGVAGNASANPAETRANRQAARIRRRESTALDHGRTTNASAEQLRPPPGDNRGVTAHAQKPPQATTLAKMSAMGLARCPGAYRRCFRGPAEGKKQPRNPSPKDRRHRQSPVAPKA